MVLTVFAAAKDRINCWIQKKNQQTERDQVLHQLLKQAREQWYLAREYFEFVKDPELVDLAINNLEAAERRFNYLLKQIREQ